jgi:benzoyl-CoA reductase/2-hydroxyglutaryl-CoA dehydratase subunit BcrC/BadD/HgdB
MKIEAIISQLAAMGANPRQAVKGAMYLTGRKAVGCFPLYTPDELIYAAGMLPVGMWGSDTPIQLATKYLQSFCCSVMKANLELGMRGAYDMLSAVIMPTFCDSLKCLGENWKTAVPDIPLISIVYPNSRAQKSGYEFLIKEYGRVLDKFEELFGVRPSEDKLEAALEVYEASRAAQRAIVQLAAKHPVTIGARTRQLILKGAFFADRAYYSTLLNELNYKLNCMPAEEWKGIKVVVSGIMLEPLGVVDIMAENDYCIAADDLANCSRQFRNAAPLGGSAIERMVGRFASMSGDPLLYEQHKTRAARLIALVKASGADGIVLAMQKFCEPEEFDYPIIKPQIEQAGIPMLYIELEQGAQGVENLRTRIQSFAEMFQ